MFPLVTNYVPLIMASTSTWPYLTSTLNAIFWQSSSAQKRITFQQMKCFLRFRLCNRCPQLNPCDQRGRGHVGHGLMTVSLLCAAHWSMTLVIPVTVQPVSKKKLRKLSRLTVTCAWPESLTLQLDLRKYCFSRENLTLFSSESIEISTFCSF